MKNILYIGPYKENTGLARSARRYIQALMSNSDINLSIRPIYCTSIIDIEQRGYLEPLERNKSTKYDYVIQHGYPEMFYFNNKFDKHIGIIEIETENLLHTGWIEKINLMDEIVIGSKLGLDTLMSAGTTAKIKYIPEPYDIDKFSLAKKEDFFEEDNSDFIFYTIGRYGEKKNIKDILLAYLLEFDIEENVRLVIKTNRYDTSSELLEKIITADIKDIQKAIRKNPSSCPKVNVLAGDIKDQDIIRLHKNGNCYINTVKADGNAQCAIEALLSNNPVITTNNIGASDFVNEKNGYIVPSLRTSVYSTDSMNVRTCSIWEYWYEPIVDSIRNKMREAFINHKLSQYIFDKTIFSHKIVGKELYE